MPGASMQQVANLSGRSTSRVRLDAVALSLSCLLLVADFSLAEAGLQRFSFVTTGISVVGVGVLLLAVLIALIVAAFRNRQRAGIGISVVLLIAVVGLCIGLHTVVLSLGSALGIQEAKMTMALALRNPSLIDFDPRISAQEREVVTTSSPGEWSLRFSNPLIVGYDFNLAARSGKRIGLRVRPSTPWRSNERVWVFEDFAYPPTAPHSDLD